MKTNLLLPIFLLFCSVGYTQKVDSSKHYQYYQSNNIESVAIEAGYVPYIIGSPEIPGYEVKIMTCKDDASTTLSNGRKIAGLSCIISESNQYIGGKLIFDGDTTVITKITIVPIDKISAKFIVKGEEFEMSFTLEEGVILAFENNYSIFNTRSIGTWTIVKKS